ncbi:uncharacterized protein LOC127279912 [Leptopilina boulardi]|uniref:uncharacterized protein LOC127279912 n=1 Tax=Leptopilina boulardi TaxID=63433 RepID=UPI0021F53087|nr:uncharacterized protein LOC127279912 [Leptopilina boulardi]
MRTRSQDQDVSSQTRESDSNDSLDVYVNAAKKFKKNVEKELLDSKSRKNDDEEDCTATTGMHSINEFFMYTSTPLSSFMVNSSILQNDLQIFSPNVSAIHGETSIIHSISDEDNIGLYFLTSVVNIFYIFILIS